MAIEEYGFGRMIVNGHEYRSDLLIYPDGKVKDSWWRSKGHELTPEDVRDLTEVQPDILVVGTGASGMLRLEAGFAEILSKQGVECRALPTERAARLYNDLLQQGKRVAACFHLTC